MKGTVDELAQLVEGASLIKETLSGRSVTHRQESAADRLDIGYQTGRSGREAIATFEWRERGV